ncbi:MAG: glycosyltransferase family 39 protein [Fuerstiella sp.]
MLKSSWGGWIGRRKFPLVLLGLPLIFHLLVGAASEPVFNGDANRHVMTSVFFHDFFLDLPVQDPKGYAQQYYEQYPALGLLIWPPLFHAVTGAVMLVAGISAWVPRAIVFLSAAASVWLIYRMAKRRDFAIEGLAAGILFSLLPMAFTYSRYVMLEMPTLCLCLWSIERFDLWLQSNKSVALYLAAFAASMAVLTRFDGAVLLPTLLLMSIFSGRVKQLFCWHAAAAVGMAACLVGPVYLLIWKEMGALHVRQATESVSGEVSQFLAPGAWSFYPSCLPDQCGWLVVALAMIGLVFGFQKKLRSLSFMFVALWLGTYCMFTPLAELSSRHAIYWLPSVSWFAVVGLLSLSQRMAAAFARNSTVDQIQRLSSGIAMSVCFLVTGACLFSIPVRYVKGYEDAAKVAFEMTSPGDTIFLDAWWEGNFIYQVRRLDVERNRFVVRGNRLLYDFTNVPTVDMQVFVENELEMLQAIAAARPTCIVFESPQPFGNIPMARRLRNLVIDHPTAFPQVKRIPVQSTFPEARQFSLYVFDVDQEKLEQQILKQQSADVLTKDSETAVFTEPMAALHH